MMYQIETMTPQEATEELRAMGLKISVPTLRLGIQQGAYPFGICIKSQNGAPVYQIFRKQFDAWCRERSVR